MFACTLNEVIKTGEYNGDEPVLPCLCACVSVIGCAHGWETAENGRPCGIREHRDKNQRVGRTWPNKGIVWEG